MNFLSIIVPALAASSILVAGSGGAPAQPLLEYALKARCIMLITEYGIWPSTSDVASSGRPLVLGVIGGSPFDTHLSEAALHRLSKGRPITIRYFKSMHEYEPCDIVFICSSESPHLQSILKQLKGKPVLTIADSDGFGSRGVMVNLYIEQERVKLEVNLTSLRASGLDLEVHVLRLARLVE